MGVAQLASQPWWGKGSGHQQDRCQGCGQHWSTRSSGHGIYHKMSSKHWGKYVAEFVHCHNIPGQETMEVRKAFMRPPEQDSCD